MAKSTAAQKEQRINEIFGLLLNGKTRYEIVQYAATNFDVKKRQVDSYIAAAHALIASEAEYHRTPQIGKAIARLNVIYGNAIAASDWTAAINAQRELNKLLSLYAPEAAKTFNLFGYDMNVLEKLALVLARRGENANQIVEEMLEAFENDESEE